MDNNNQDERKVQFITDLMIKYKIDKISKQKMDIYFKERMNILSDISGNPDNTLELKNYFDYSVVKFTPIKFIFGVFDKFGYKKLAVLTFSCGCCKLDSSVD